MANINILNLPVATGLSASDYVPVVQGTGGDAVTRRATIGQVSANALQLSLDNISTSQGAILFRNATDWVALAPGTAGQILITGGSSADPSWGEFAFSAKTANTFLGGPTTGSPAIPTFRALVAADLPGTVLVWGS